MYLESVSDPMELQCNSVESLEQFCSGLQSAQDRYWMLRTRSFFEEGGKLAQFAVSPIKKSGSILDEMIGTQRGFKRGSGLSLIKKSVEFADLVAVPQARDMLNLEESKRFHECLFAATRETESFFALVEPPKRLDPHEAVSWAKSLTCPDAAAYYPEVIDSGKEGLPPAEISVLPAVAGLYQCADEENGIAELPTLKVCQSQLKPRMRLTPSWQMELLATRLNSVVFAPGLGEKVRVWGGHTLTRAPETEFALIPVRRTLRALSEAVQSIAEGYVLEPLAVDIVTDIEYRIHSFLEEHRNIFDPFTKSPFDVRASRLKGRDSDGIEINCRFKLSRCVQELKLNFGVS